MVNAANVMATPRFLDVAITSQCNLRCKYCSHFSGPGDVEHELSSKQWCRFFAKLEELCVMRITLQGGEPFCRDDIKELVAAIVRHRMRFQVLSNGTLITRDMAAFLAATKRCDNVQISIDGANSQAHDVLRGAGSFARSVQAISYLKECGVPVSVRITLHRHNVSSLKEVARLLLEEMEVEQISTNCASYLGLCRKNAGQVMLTQDQHRHSLEVLLALSQRYPGRVGAAAGPLAQARLWLAMEQARQQGLEGLPGGGYLSACGGPADTIAVRADGAIVPCIQMSHLVLGHIDRDDLRAIWQKHPQLKRLRQRHLTPLSDFEFCSNCDYIAYCTGNCPALAYSIAGNDHHPSPDACLKRFLDNGGVLPNEALLFQ